MSGECDKPQDQASNLAFVPSHEVTQAKANLYSQLIAVMATGQDAYALNAVNFAPTTQFVTKVMNLTNTAVQIDTTEIPPAHLITQVVIRGENIQWAGRENDDYITVIGQEILDMIINPEHNPADFPKPFIKAVGSSAQATIIYSTMPFKETDC